jgi:hypothetical protein
MSGELKELEGINRQIEILRHVVGEIRECRDIGKVKRVADWAQMVKTAAKRVGASVEVQNEAATAALKARHWEGTLLKERDMKKGGRPSTNGKTCQSAGRVSETLAELGITRNESSQAQAIAAMSAERLDREIHTKQATGGELVTKDFVRLGRSIQARRDARSAPAEKPPPTDADLGRMALARLLKLLDETITLIGNRGGASVLLEGCTFDNKEEFLGAFDRWMADSHAIGSELLRIIKDKVSWGGGA